MLSSVVRSGDGIECSKCDNDKCLSLDDHKYGDWINALTAVVAVGWVEDNDGCDDDKFTPNNLSVVRLERYGADWARATSASSSR